MAVIKRVFPEYINDFYLMLTEKCPLRCEYCYIANKTGDEKMSMATIERFVELTKDRKARLIFFGGEPLLEIDTIKTVVDRYSNHFSKFQVVTSAVVNFEKFIDEIYAPYKDKFELQISWDGYADTRKLANGQSVAKSVWSKIERLIDSGLEFQIRTVINDTNIDELYSLYKQFSDMYWQEPNFFADFTIAHQTNFASTFAAKYATQLKYVLTDIENKLKNNQIPFLPQWILQILTGIINNEPIMACNVGSEIVIRPNGDIYPCTMLSQSKHGKNFCLGNINERQSYDFAKIDYLLAKQKECFGCKYEHACTGGCRYERVMLCGTVDGINSGYCLQTKATYETVRAWLENLDASTRLKIGKYCANYLLWTTCSQSQNSHTARKYRLKEVVLS